MEMFLGLDIGTTSTIGILIALPDKVVGVASRPVSLSTPKPGWAEEDPDEWWSNVRAILAEFGERGIDTGAIAAVGVTGMLPAVVLLDGEGRLIRPSIQQSDGRCGAEVEDIKAEIDPLRFLKKAGNGVNQQLVLAKLRWIERHEPENFARIATVFGSYDYINWRLTGAARDRAELGARGGFRQPRPARGRSRADGACPYLSRSVAAAFRVAFHSWRGHERSGGRNGSP